MTKSIVLAGFSGTGKSTIGRLTAQRSGSAFIDTDAEIYKLAGKSIKRIFAEDGEVAFRKIEAEVCQQAAQTSNTVIATGGGALLDSTTIELFLANCCVVNLKTNLAVIEKRLKNDRHRPLFKDKEAFRTLFDERASLYNQLPHQIDVTDKTPLVIADEIIKLWNLIG